MGALGCLVGGLATDGFVRRTGNRRLGRRLFGVLGHALTVICFLLCPLMPTAISFFVMISLSGFFTDLTMGSSWAACQDIGRRYAAIVAGFMNMVGNFGGFVAILISGFVFDYGKAIHAQKLGTTSDLLVGTGLKDGLMIGYQINFLVFAAVYVTGVLCWLRIDASKPAADD